MQRPEGSFLKLVVNVDVERLPGHLVLGKVKALPVVDQSKGWESRGWMVQHMAARGAGDHLSHWGRARSDGAGGGSWG